MTQTNTVVVAVSPFYSGMGWEDTASGLTFNPTNKIETVRISKDRDLSGIKNALRLNHLLLIEGELEVGEELDKDALYQGMLPDNLFQAAITSDSGGPELIAQLESTVSELKGETAQLESQISTLEDTTEALQRENQQLNDEISQLEASIEALEQELENGPEIWTQTGANAHTVVELKAFLDGYGIEYTEADLKADLVSKLIGRVKQ